MHHALFFPLKFVSLPQTADQVDIFKFTSVFLVILRVGEMGSFPSHSVSFADQPPSSANPLSLAFLIHVGSFD